MAEETRLQAATPASSPLVAPQMAEGGAHGWNPLTGGHSYMPSLRHYKAHSLEEQRVLLRKMAENVRGKYVLLHP